jgi:hypothetical protein
LTTPIYQGEFVADLYTPLPWLDGPTSGTPLTAARGPNRWEAGIEALDVAVDTLTDRVDALQAGGASTSTWPNGPTANRPAPGAGKIYFDTTLNKPLWGDGSAWRTADGLIVAGAGGSNAPQNMRGVVNPDNSIQLNWDAVTGAASYKLYEIRSPTGVANGTYTTNSALRTPGGTGNYEYWVTATVAGVESAASNHALVTLPYGSTPTDPGGSTGSSPADILAIGGAGGYWNLGVGYPSGHVDKTYSQLINGYEEFPYFVPNDTGTAVSFRQPMNGGTTSSNTQYARVELRELKSDGTTKAAWVANSGTHRLQGRTKVLHYPPNKQELCIAQIHDGSDDRVQVRCEGTNVVVNIGGTEAGTLATGVAVGTEFLWEIELISGTLRIKYNGVTKVTSSHFSGDGVAHQYFKAGCYGQANTTHNSSSEYFQMEMRSLVCTHA